MTWSPELPVHELPKILQKYFVVEARYLLADLRQNRLEVVLIPAQNPKHHSHKVRAVQNQNPDWYRDLYHSTRHFRRGRSINALERICSLADQLPKENPKQYQYDVVYRQLIFERLTEGYITNGCPVLPQIHNI